MKPSNDTVLSLLTKKPSQISLFSSLFSFSLSDLDIDSKKKESSFLAKTGGVIVQQHHQHHQQKNFSSSFTHSKTYTVKHIYIYFSSYNQQLAPLSIHPSTHPF